VTDKQIVIQLLNDTVAESEEQFRFVLSNPSGDVRCSLECRDPDP